MSKIEKIAKEVADGVKPICGICEKELEADDDIGICGSCMDMRTQPDYLDDVE